MHMVYDVGTLKCWDCLLTNPATSGPEAARQDADRKRRQSACSRVLNENASPSCNLVTECDIAQAHICFEAVSLSRSNEHTPGYFAMNPIALLCILNHTTIVLHAHIQP